MPRQTVTQLSARSSAAIRALGLLLLLSAAPAIFAQIAPRPPGEGGPSPLQPNTSSIRADFNVGLQFHRPLRWSLISARVTNTFDTDQTWRLIFQYNDQPDAQFIRNIFVPAGGTRRVIMPVRRNTDQMPPSRSVNSTLLLTPPGEEVQLVRQPSFARLLPDERAFLYLTDQSDQPDQMASAVLMNTLRRRANLADVYAFVRDRDLMEIEPAWDGIEVVAVSSIDPDPSPAATRALRRWLHAGGTLVVFADLTSDEAMRRLIGDHWSTAAIDTVTLDSVQWLDATAFETARPGSADREPRNLGNATFEKPVRFARHFAEGFEPLITVNGYPALAVKQAGAGRIVLVTLEARAWAQASTPDPRAAGAMNALSAAILGTTGQPPAPAPSLTIAGSPAASLFVSNQVGYRVLPRPTLIGILGFFIAALIGAFLFFARSARPERGALTAAVIAAFTLAAILAAGFASRGTLEPTLATLQVIAAPAASSDLDVHLIAGLYDAQGRTTRISAETTGLPHLPAATRAGQLERLDVGPLEGWAMPSLSLPGGAVRPLRLDTAAQPASPAHADARFTAEGLVADVSLPEGRLLEDALLVTPHAILAPRAGTDSTPGTLTFGADSILDSGVLSGQAVLGEQTQQRLALLREALHRPDGSPLFDRPVLIGFSEGLSLGLETDPPLQPRHTALWMLDLEPRPAADPGESVTIPWPFVTMTENRAAAQQARLRAQTLYREATRQWIDEVFGASAFLADFTLPAQTGPLQLQSARIHLNIEAPVHPIRLILFDGRTVHEIASRTGFDGNLTADIPAELLASAGRSLTVGFDVGDPSSAPSAGQPRGGQRWRVRWFGLELTGSTAPTTSAANPPASN